MSTDKQPHMGVHALEPCAVCHHKHLLDHLKTGTEHLSKSLVKGGGQAGVGAALGFY